MLSREPVNTVRGVAWVPVISGNALRHRAVRAPGMTYLIDLYGLAGKLNLAQLNFLLHGGNLTESTAMENTRRIATMAHCWPLLKLVGGALPNQILSGHLASWRGTLVCAENAPSLAALIGDSFPTQRLLSCERFVNDYQYTRGDAKKSGLAPPTEGEESSNLMIYSGQCVIRGALFHHGFALTHSNELELGALLWSLRLWQAGGGTVGGMAAKGHGRLRTEIILPDGIDQEACVGTYLDHVASVKDEAIAWLNDAWAPRVERPAKAAKKPKTAKEPEPVEGATLFGESDE